MITDCTRWQNKTIKISEEMPIHYDIETDALYMRGTEKGIEKGIEKGREEEAAKKNHLFVSNLLLNTDFSDDKIARLADVSIEFVNQLRAELLKKK